MCTTDELKTTFLKLFKLIHSALRIIARMAVGLLRTRGRRSVALALVVLRVLGLPRPPQVHRNPRGGEDSGGKVEVAFGDPRVHALQGKLAI